VVIPGLDRLLALVGARAKEHEPEPGRPAPDPELARRIDAARVRLRAEIASPEE
jgi:hypothetical protein